MRRTWSRGLSLLLSAALVLGLGCGTAGAYGDMPGGAGSTSSSHEPLDQSQGALTQESGMVIITQPDGTVITYTSAHFGGRVSFPEPGPYPIEEQADLKTIIVEPGCIAYAITPDGKVYDGDEEFAELGVLEFCLFGVKSDGTIQRIGYSGATAMGNVYAGFGVDVGYFQEYSLVMCTFYGDDSRYWMVTQEALDLFTSLTGIEETGAPEQPTFSDVSPDAWYYSFVEMAAEKGLFAGTGDGTFAPEASMTYAEFLTVLSQFSGESLTPVTGGAWYDTYVQWAQPLIPEGMKEHFNPTAPITRQDMAALFGNFLERYDHPGQPVNNQVPSFVDSGDVADYAADGVTAVYQMGLMSGADGNRFLPLATATRAQVAVTMVQMARVMGR